MTTLEIMQRIAANHNRIAQVVVSGDNAILIGDTLRDLRQLVQVLSEQAEQEKNERENSEQENDSTNDE